MSVAWRKHKNQHRAIYIVYTGIWRSSGCADLISDYPISDSVSTGSDLSYFTIGLSFCFFLPLPLLPYIHCKSHTTFVSLKNSFASIIV